VQRKQAKPGCLAIGNAQTRTSPCGGVGACRVALDGSCSIHRHDSPGTSDCDGAARLSVKMLNTKSVVVQDSPPPALPRRRGVCRSQCLSLQKTLPKWRATGTDHAHHPRHFLPHPVRTRARARAPSPAASLNAAFYPSSATFHWAQEDGRCSKCICPRVRKTRVDKGTCSTNPLPVASRLKPAEQQTSRIAPAFPRPRAS
jgi:hypothetical protein